MQAEDIVSPVPPLPDPAPPSEPEVARLVAHVYESAAPSERCRLIEHLLAPLGVLSRVAVAQGVFAGLCLRSRQRRILAEAEDLRAVGRDHVVALVEHVQQVSIESVDALAHWLGSSPSAMRSEAAATLAAALSLRARRRERLRAEAGLAARDSD